MDNTAKGFGDRARAEVQVEQDLWDALLNAEGVQFHWEETEQLPQEEMSIVEENSDLRASYPWNVAEPTAEAFFTDLERNFNIDNWRTEEIANRSQVFFAHLDQLWATTAVQETLAQRFAARIPQNLLATIAQQAQQVLATSTSLADQLVQCVQETLPSLATEDLYVLARPLAHALRNGQSQNAVDSVLAKVRPVEWEQLSEIEQARLSLAVARCALDEIKSQAQE